MNNEKRTRTSASLRWRLLALLAAAAGLLSALWLRGVIGSSGGVAAGEPTARGLVATRCFTSRDRAPWRTAPCPQDGRLRAGPAERLRVSLSDRTTLWLKSGSEVRLLDGRVRELRLERGDLLVDVVHREDLPPLQVRAPGGHLKVVGTQLHLAVRSQATVLDVLRGEVVVSSGGQRAPVVAGGEALLRDGEAPLVRAAADLGAATEWADSSASDPRGNGGFGRLSARRPGRRQDTERALRLVDHKVEVRIQGRVARTIVTETFHNDTGHVLEGVYKFPLPADARIAALDLLVDGKWEHGAIVDRARGDKIWRGVIRNATPRAKRRVPKTEYVWVPGPWHDPALLKWKKGSEFELRIFPIPKRGGRTVRIAYTQVLIPVPGGYRYVLPLAADPGGKPRAERFRFEARVGGGANGLDVRVSPYQMQRTRRKGALLLGLDRAPFAPSGDIVLDVPSDRLGKELSAWTYSSPNHPGEGYLLLALRPALPAWSRRDPLKVLFVVDSSYSVQRARLRRAAELVSRVTRELGKGSSVHLLACNQRCQELGPGFRPGGEATAADLRQRVLALEPLGSTRLLHALERAGAVLDRGPKGAGARVIYLGDGVPTVGELDPARLARRSGLALGSARLTTVSLGGHSDEVILRGLARAGRGAFVAHDAGTSLRATAIRVVQRQWGEPLRDVTLKLPPGVDRVAPAGLGDLWPGEERLVAGRIRSDVEGDVVLCGSLAGRPFERRFRVKLRPRNVPGNAFLPRLWAERRIDDLQQREGEASRERIVEISKGHHVLSRYTSLLVLESPAMARAFKVKATRPPTEWTGDEAAAESETTPVGKGLATRASALQKSRPQMASSAGGMADLLRAKRSEGPRGALREMPIRRGRFRRMIRMKRVWYRAVAISAPGGLRASEVAELGRRRRRLAKSPLSRGATRDLVRYHVRLGDLEAARRLATRWLAKDRMDASALIELAGIAALAGERRRSLDLLASAVDADPTSVAAHTRMLNLYGALGNRDMRCAHALTRALVAPKSWRHQVAAARCDQDIQRHMANLSPRRRRRALRVLARRTKPPRLWGRLKVLATWSSGPDLDIVVVSPRGRVISWLGGARKVRTAAVRSALREVLAISMEETGRYQIWMVPEAGKRAVVSGSVRVGSYGKTRSFRFTASGRPVRVAEVRLRWRSRLVPAPWRGHGPIR